MRAKSFLTGKTMETKASAYFSSLNPFSKKIVTDQNFVKNLYGDEWEKFDLTKQEDLIDDYIVEPDTRKKYADHPDTDSQPTAPQSFPKLVVQSGEKIVVDYGNDYWTWQDEHSAPFSWKSKSQENLSLIDLDPEELSKPSSKSKRKASQSKSQAPEKSEKTFAWKPDKTSSIWNNPILAGMKKTGGFKVIPSSPDDKLINDNDTSREDDSTTCMSPEGPNATVVQEQEDLKFNKKSKKSPSKSSKKSPKGLMSRKFPLSPSFSKNNSSDSTVSLVNEKTTSNDENRDRRSNTPSKSSLKEENAFDNLALERSAFENPATIEDEWSSFVGERNMTDSLSSATSSPSHQLLKEPQSQSIDRLDGKGSVTKSPSRSSNLSGDADTSSLLKNTDYENTALTNRFSGLDLGKDLEGNTTVSSQKSGFDFLDDW